MPAPNERFGTTAAVTPLKVTCEHERKYPAERAVKAAAAPSRWSLSATNGVQTEILKDMKEKKYFIDQYKKLKDLNDGQKPLYRDFLMYCNNIHPRKLIETFGSNPYSKLQEECGDNPNKLQIIRTPLQQILDQYGNLVKSHNKVPVTSDWTHAKYKPTTDAIRIVHGIKWREIPLVFIKEYGNKPEWKSVIEILKRETDNFTTVTVSKTFNDIVEKIEKWNPDRKRIIEEGYKIELRNYLEKHFKIEEETGESHPDLLINGKYPIEIKKDPSQSEYDRLLGQMLRHNKLFGSAIAVVTNISSEDRFKKNQKLFQEIHNGLNMTTELIKK